MMVKRWQQRYFALYETKLVRSDPVESIRGTPAAQSIRSYGPMCSRLIHGFSGHLDSLA